MYNKLPQSTKQYLSLLMEDKIHENRGDNTIDFKKSYLSKFNNLQEQDCSKYFNLIKSGKQASVPIPQECLQAYQEKLAKESLEKDLKADGGSGGGLDGKPKPKSPNLDSTPEKEKSQDYWGFLDMSSMKNPLDILGGADVVGGAAGSYIVGGLGELLAKGKWAPAAAGAIASKFPGPIGQAVAGKMGRVVGKAGEAFSDILAQKYVDVNADDLAYQLGANLLGGAGKPFVKLQMPVRQDDRYDWWRRQSLLQQSN